MKQLSEMLPPTGSEPYKKTDANNMTSEPVCEICGGTGWISAEVPFGHPKFGKAQMCPHLLTEVNQSLTQRRWQELGALRNMTFDTFDTRGREGHILTPQQSLSLRSAVSQLQENFVEERRGWILLIGTYGCGKTHLAAAIANALLAKGVPVVFVNVPDLLDYLRATYSPGTEETYDQRFNEIVNAPVLVLDDLGAQNATPWAGEKLYQIINARYIAKLPTVITTNLNLENLDPRVRSRLSDADLVRKISILAPDYRRGYQEEEGSSIGSLQLYHTMTFESFEIRSNLTREERTNLELALAQARDFAKDPQNWLMFTGKYGVGKTHLAAAIANYQAIRVYPAMFVVVPDLLDHLRAAFSPDAHTSFDQRFEEVRTAALLVLDDLGTESATPWAREKLYQIINHRYVAKLPTVITTSVSPDDLDPRIRTRILDETRCLVVPLIAPSYRGGHDNRPAAVSKPPRSRTTRR
jgi:DNA replication protein DnaC